MIRCVFQREHRYTASGSSGSIHRARRRARARLQSGADGCLAPATCRPATHDFHGYSSLPVKIVAEVALLSQPLQLLRLDDPVFPVRAVPAPRAPIRLDAAKESAHGPVRDEPFAALVSALVLVLALPELPFFLFTSYSRPFDDAAQVVVLASVLCYDEL